jgi:hypothetical protein
VSAAGDLNGDGFADLVIGAPPTHPDGERYAGRCYVVLGGHDVANGGSVDLAALDGTNGFIVDGVNAYDRSGYSVSAAGDVNGDGFGDIMMDAWFGSPYDPDAGATYVVFGSDDIGGSGSFDLATLDGSNGFVLTGSRGPSASGARDVNGDGFDDLIVSNFGRNDVYVVFGDAAVGSDGSIDLLALDGSTGFLMRETSEPGTELGISVSGAGDVNGDDFGDLLIGSRADPNGQPYAGETFLVFGGAELGSSGYFELSELDGTNGIILHGIDAYDYSGYSVSDAGDLNGDGFADVIIGAEQADPNGQSSAGETYVVFGHAPDVDGDGVLDADDNCTLLANPDQRDTNGDGFGNRCDPDLDGNGVVSFVDLGRLRAVFFTAHPNADFDGDGAVNFIDLGIMKEFFFRPPGPSGISP